MKRILITTILILNALLAFSQVTYQYDNLNRLSQVTYDNGLTITYAYDELSNRLTKTVSGNIAVTGVSLNKTATTLPVNGTEQLTATIAPADATDKNVTWSSNNPSVATVDNGLVRAVAAGTAIITVTTQDSGKTASCEVTATLGSNATSTPFTEDFESDVSEWTLTGGITNRWVVGTATSYSGNASLYISNTNGAGNEYGVNSGSATHSYCDIYFSPSPVDYLLSFDWKGMGESGYDYLEVHLIEISDTPEEGVLFTSSNLLDSYGGSDTWQHATLSLSAGLYSGTTKRLVFTWRNNSIGGTQPPIAIDNVQVTAGEATAFYAIAFHSNGGSPVDTQVVAAGDTVPRPADPTKAGYTFAGWYGNPDLTEPWRFATGTVTGDTTLYAAWAVAGASDSIWEDGFTVVSSYIFEDGTVTLLKKVWQSDSYRVNPDGTRFYRTALAVGVERSGVRSMSIISLEDVLYNSLSKSMTPCMLVDLERSVISVFASSKDASGGDFGMDGYVYRIDLNAQAWQRETVFTQANFGWYAFFGGSDAGNPELWHFSYAGYYAMYSKRSDAESWTYSQQGSVSPGIADRQYYSHRNILVASAAGVDAMSSQDNAAYDSFSGFVNNRPSEPLILGAGQVCEILGICAEQPGVTLLCTAWDSVLTAGETYAISYEGTGVFVEGNVLQVQLSDRDGSFVGWTAIGSVAFSHADPLGVFSGSIPVTIPSTVAPGSGYRIRLAATAPVFRSADNGADIAIVNESYMDDFSRAILHPSSVRLSFAQSPDYPWVAADGYVRSGNAGVGGSSSWFSATLSHTDSVSVSFEWQAGSESGYDFFRFTANGESHISHSGNAAGFTAYTLALPAGYHTLRWEYEKDGIIDLGTDEARVRLLRVAYRQPGNPPTVAVTGVELSHTSISLAAGATLALVAVIAPANATNRLVTWSSSNEAIATVSQGLVTALASGNAVVTATTADGGFTDSCVVIVQPSAITGVEEVGSGAVALYPNPAAGYVTLGGVPAGSTVWVFDVGGQLHIHRILTGESERLFVGNLAAGSYLVRIAGGKGSQTLKLVVK